jgi:hypothetical protein
MPQQRQFPRRRTDRCASNSIQQMKGNFMNHKKIKHYFAMKIRSLVARRKPIGEQQRADSDANLLKNDHANA